MFCWTSIFELRHLLWVRWAAFRSHHRILIRFLRLLSLHLFNSEFPLPFPISRQFIQFPYSRDLVRTDEAAYRRLKRKRKKRSSQRGAKRVSKEKNEKLALTAHSRLSGRFLISSGFVFEYLHRVFIEASMPTTRSYVSFSNISRASKRQFNSSGAFLHFGVKGGFLISPYIPVIFPFGISRVVLFTCHG